MGLIGGLAGGLFGGLAGLAAGPAPEYQQVKWGGGKKFNFDDAQARADRSADELQGIYQEGVAEAGQGMQKTAPEIAASESALGSVAPANLGEALRRRASKSYDRDLNTIKRQSEVMSLDNRRSAQDAARSRLQAKEAEDYRQGQIAQQAEAEAQAARYSVWNNLLGGIGTAAGAMVGNIMKTPMKTVTSTDKGIEAGTMLGPAKPDMAAYGWDTRGGRNG